MKLYSAVCVCVGVACVDAYTYTVEAAARGWARGITISISVDQGEAPSNPGLYPGSRTPQLGLILPSSLQPAEQRRTLVCVHLFVCVYMGVWCGYGGQLANFALGMEIPP